MQSSDIVFFKTCNILLRFNPWSKMGNCLHSRIQKTDTRV